KIERCRAQIGAQTGAIDLALSDDDQPVIARIKPTDLVNAQHPLATDVPRDDNVAAQFLQFIRRQAVPRGGVVRQCPQGSGEGKAGGVVDSKAHVNQGTAESSVVRLVGAAMESVNRAGSRNRMRLKARRLRADGLTSAAHSRVHDGLKRSQAGRLSE